MKILSLVAAAAVAFVAMPAAASAAPAAAATVASAAVVQHVTVRINDRHHHGRRVYWKRVCRTAWRNHHRVRTCTRVRAWR
jgi:hypothetical protein